MKVMSSLMDIYDVVGKNAEISGVNHLPLELTAMIVEYYSVEWVHLFNRFDGKHWKISVQDILGDNQE